MSATWSTVVLGMAGAGLLAFAAVVVLRRFAGDVWMLVHALSELREDERRSKGNGR